PEGTVPVYSDGVLTYLAEPLGEAVFPGEVPAYYYSYAGHRYTCFCTTKPDNGDIPHLAKDTVTRSLVMRVKTPASGETEVWVRTDREPWSLSEKCVTGRLDFGMTDFSSLAFSAESGATVPVKERKRRWCYKQLMLTSRVFRHPFGVYEIAYSFRVSGRVRD
ncbi:MAG: hypothetical protein MJ078_01490, partial [Clostridia bacterium]|nr:hypothetical protein [Clostridia bacterium]